MKKKFYIYVALCLILLLITKAPLQAQTEPVTEVTFMALELWPDFDRPSLLVIHSMLLPPHQTYPAEVVYTLPVGSTLHTVAQFDQNSQSLSDAVDYKQEGETLFINVTRGGLRVEYYSPYEQVGENHQIEFVWPSDFTADLLQISIQQPRHAQNFVLDSEIMESRVTDNDLRYLILPPRDSTRGEVIALSFSYDLLDGRLSAPPTAEVADTTESEPSIANNLFNNLPFVGLAFLLLLVSVVFLRQGWRERQGREVAAASSVCGNCGETSGGGDQYCRHCGEPI